MKPFVTFASIACFAGLLLAGCGSKSESAAHHPPAGAPVQVQTQVVESKSRPIIEEIVGTIRAKLHATLEAKLSGRIEALPVTLGDQVQPGQLIARLDAAEVKARLDQAQAGLDKAELDWKRTSNLFSQQGATQAEYDVVESRRRMAQASLAEAKAMAGYVEIVAPFSGVVTRKYAERGDLAVPGKPLVDIDDPTALQLQAEVPEAIATRIQRGARLDIRVDAAGQDLTGTVSEIAPAADPVSRTFSAKLDLPSTPGLMPGQFARLLAPIGENRSLRIPTSAVVHRGQLEIVFVVQDQKASLHLVKTGRRIGDEVEILSGLDHGDRVVVSGADQLVDGQEVKG